MENLFFSTNWNRKLCCHSFSSIRYPSDKYVPNSKFNVYVDTPEGKLVVSDNKGNPRKVEYYGTVKLLSRKRVTLKTLNDEVCLLDTGYNAEATKRLLGRMYKDYIEKHGENAEFLWLLFEYDDGLLDLDILMMQHDVTSIPQERTHAIIKALTKRLSHVA